MMKIRTVIIDDEISARRTLQTILKDFFPRVEVIGEAESVADAIKCIEEKQPELVFLDVELKFGTGFDVLENIAFRDFQVIFVTAYENYAIRSFRFSALDYLLKPVRISHLREAVERLGENQRLSISSGQIRNARESYMGMQGRPDRIVLPGNESYEIVSLEDVMRIEGAKNYSVFHLVDGVQLVVTKTLKEYEEMLSGRGFVRVHKSHLVNLTRIRRYIRGRGGEVVMEDGSVLPVSRDRKELLLQYFGGLGR